MGVDAGKQQRTEPSSARRGIVVVDRVLLEEEEYFSAGGANPAEEEHDCSTGGFDPANISKYLVLSLTESLLRGGGEDLVRLDTDLIEVLIYLRRLWDERGFDDMSLAPVLRCVGVALAKNSATAPAPTSAAEDADESDDGRGKEALPSSGGREHSLLFLMEALRVERLRMQDEEDAEEKGEQDEESPSVSSSSSSLSTSRANLDLIISLNAVGECLLELSDPSSAVEYLDEASELGRNHLHRRQRYEQSPSDEPSSSVAGAAELLVIATAAYNAGRAYFELRRADESEKQFDFAVVLAGSAAEADIEDDGCETEDDDDDAEAAAKLQRLVQCGSLLHNAGMYKVELSSWQCDGDIDRSGRVDALFCFRCALTARRSALGPDHLSVADTLHEVSSRLYYLSKQRGGQEDDDGGQATLAEALVGFWECLRIEKLAYGDGMFHPKMEVTKSNIRAIEEEIREQA